MSGIFTLGVSHHTAPLALREQLALTEGRAAGPASPSAARPAESGREAEQLGGGIPRG